jgi:hypothetical protein
MRINIKVDIEMVDPDDPVEKGHAAHAADIIERHLRASQEELKAYVEANEDVSEGPGGFQIKYQDPDY